MLEWTPEPQVVGRLKSPTLSGAFPFTVGESVWQIGVLLEGQWRFGEAELMEVDLRAEGLVAVRIISLSYGSGENLEELTFHLVNFPRYDGPLVKTGDTFAHGRAVLASDPWEITIDPLAETSDLLDELRRTGGYAITHVGRLRRSDDKSFSADEAQGLTEALYLYLSFARGSWGGPILPVGTGKGGEKWGWWNDSALQDRGRGPWFSWLPAPGEGAALEAAWPGFLRLLNSGDWRRTLSLAINCYLEANSGRFVESQIVLGQAGLELLAWVKIVEEDRVLSSDSFNKLSAADRLSLLLARSGIPKDIPTTLKDLREYAAAFNLKDGPSAITELRNSVVHANRRDRILAASIEVRIDAWRLMMGYLELALLRLWDYGGRYHSWVAAPGPPSKVPWG